MTPPVSSDPFDFEVLSNPFVSDLSEEQDHSWWYKDPNGEMRGPFRGAEMYSWYKGGFFHDELEITSGQNSLLFPLKKFKDAAHQRVQAAYYKLNKTQQQQAHCQLQAPQAKPQQPPMGVPDE